LKNPMTSEDKKLYRKLREWNPWNGYSIERRLVRYGGDYLDWEYHNFKTDKTWVETEYDT